MTSIISPLSTTHGYVRSVVFFVPGKPIPAGSKTVGRKKDGSFFVRDASGARGKAWRKTIREVAQTLSVRMDAGPLALRLVFFVSRPKDHWNKSGLSAKGARTPYPLGPPDTTKLVRAVEDALTGLLWKDDAQIVDQVASKRYCDTAETPEGVYIVLGIYAKEESGGNAESRGTGDRDYA